MPHAAGDDYVKGLTDKVAISTVTGALSLTDVIARAQARKKRSIFVAVDASALLPVYNRGRSRTSKHPWRVGDPSFLRRLMSRLQGGPAQQL